MFKINTVKKLVLLSVVLLIGLNSNIASAQIINARPQQMLGFKWISGQSKWANANYSRLTRSVWQFNTADRSVVMYQPDGYPTLRGFYRFNNGAVIVQAYYNSRTGFSGSQTAEFYGKIDFSSGKPVLSMAYVSGSTLAAVINGSSFGSNNGKAYQARLILR